MDSKSDEIAKIKEASRYMSDWLAKYQVYSKIVPRALEIRDQLDWQENVLTNCPSGVTIFMGSESGTPTEP